MTTSGVITPERIAELRKKFYADRQNVLSQNICTKQDPIEALVLRKSLETINHVFSHKIDCEGKPVTNQKKSGRCWLFAVLNCMRIPFMKAYNLEEFEFSQAYLFFWDKIERVNFILHNIVLSAKKGEPVDGRTVSFLLNNPMEDGGQWGMIVNIISRYGVMPKTCFPESFSSENSMRMDSILSSKIREYSKALRDLVAKKVSDAELESKIDEQMTVIYRMVGICLGIPSETFTWEYYDKSKMYNSVGPMTPLEFYENYVRPHFNVRDKICLVNDPRPSSAFGQLYTVEYMGNVVGGDIVTYNNQSADLILKFVAESIKQNEPVWFGCAMSKRMAAKQGIHYLECLDYKTVFGTEIQLSMNKSDRLIYGDAFMTHAMVITAMTLDDKGEITKMRVENSWGTERGDKGYIVMSRDWFAEFGFEIVVDKKYLPLDVLAVQDQTPIVLPPWDPMGMLAK